MSVVAMWHFTAATEHLKNQIISSFSMYSQRRDFESPLNRLTYHLLFKLIRTSLDKNWPSDYEVLKFTDWKEVINIASAHGLSAIAYDGLKMSLDSNQNVGMRFRSHCFCNGMGNVFIKRLCSIRTGVHPVRCPRFWVSTALRRLY